MWHSDRDYECQNLCLRRLSALTGKYQWPTSRSLEKQNQMVFGTRYLKDLNRTHWEPMEFEWKYSQDSLQWASSKRFKNIWLNYSVSLSSSKEGSSSCKCTTTLYGENKETQKNDRRILLQLRIMLADSRSDVGHFWDLDQRRNGTELILINQMENGTRLLNEWCSTLQKAVILSFVPPAPWKESN